MKVLYNDTDMLMPILKLVSLINKYQTSLSSLMKENFEHNKNRVIQQ